MAIFGTTVKLLVGALAGYAGPSVVDQLHRDYSTTTPTSEDAKNASDAQKRLVNAGVLKPSVIHYPLGFSVYGRSTDMLPSVSLFCRVGSYALTLERTRNGGGFTYTRNNKR